MSGEERDRMIRSWFETSPKQTPIRNSPHVVWIVSHTIRRSGEEMAKAAVERAAERIKSKADGVDCPT